MPLLPRHSPPAPTRRAAWCIRTALLVGITICLVTVVKVAQLTTMPGVGIDRIPRILHAGLPPPAAPQAGAKSVAIKSYCAGDAPPSQLLPATLAELASMPRYLAAALMERDLETELWESRAQPFLNIFFVWLSHRDTWMGIQDRVLASVLTIPNARIRVVSNSLPHEMFAHLIQDGHDISVMRYNLTAWMQDMPGASWVAQMQSVAEAPYAETQLSDFIRLLVLYKFGGLYLDTDALWIGDMASLPASFIGKIDYLKLEPSCDFCLDKRWYLANGVLSFRARHPFIRHLLMKIDEHPYDPLSRTDIGPKFLTVEYQAAGQSLVRDIGILEERVLYPIPGPDVPKYMVAADNAADVARQVLAESRSVHVFTYTFNQLPIAAESTFGILLRTLRGPLRESLCVCEVLSSLSSVVLCTPQSVVIPYRPLPHSWFWPYARICINVRASGVLSAGLRAMPIKLTISAEHGVLRHWRTAPARKLDIDIDSLGAVNDALSSLEYRHAGGYCNDVVEVTATWRSEAITVKVAVSAPCMDAAKLLAVPGELQRANPASWKELLGPEVASVTTTDLEADSIKQREFGRCVRVGGHRMLSSKPTACTKIALLVSATGSYVAWLDELILSAEQYFMPGYQVHYFILTDRHELAMEPRERIHVIYQRQLGWPMDSMYRHQLYLKHRTVFKEMDFIMVLDADAAFHAPVGPEILGKSMGTLQSFFFGQPPSAAPFENDPKSSSFIGSSGTCYYAGGLFGGSLHGFTTLLQRSTWLMEWDLVMLHRTAPHDDESYLNKMFHVYPPEVSLGGNYIMPEPPADRAWGLKGVNWKDVFPPKIYNLGARKWLGGTAGVDRDYQNVADPLVVLTSADTIAPLPAMDIAICAPLQGKRSSRGEWVERLVASVDRWYSTSAHITVMDTSPGDTDNIPPPMDKARVRYIQASGAMRSIPGAPPCPPAALAKLLEVARAQHVLIIGRQATLTWQSSLQFLALAAHDLPRQSSNDGRAAKAVLGLCPSVPADSARESARFAAGEGCVAAVLEDGSVQPSYGCGLCEVWPEDQVAAPAIRAETAMRTFACFDLDDAAALRDYHAIVADAEQLREPVQALATNVISRRLPGACGIGCVAASALTLSSQAAQAAAARGHPASAAGNPNAGRTRLAANVNAYRCIADMQPFMSEPTTLAA